METCAGRDSNTKKINLKIKKRILKTYPMVLVGSDGGELGLREGEGLEVLLAVGHLAPRRAVDHMEARLVAVHRIQDHLRMRNK